VLCDADGLVLRALTGPGLSDAVLEATNLFEGASWHERDIGCNGAGTALATGEPVILIGPEHFVEAYATWTCIGVPIADPSGRVVGAIDLSVPNEHTTAQTWGWTLSIARGIEAALARPLHASRREAELAVPAVDEPLQLVRGVIELFGAQLGPTAAHDAFVGEARSSLADAEAQLDAAVSRAIRSEREARRELAEIRAIYDNAPVGLCVLDRELRYQRINERLAAINGVPAAAHIGRTVREIVPALADEAEPALRRVLESGEAVLGLELSGETAAAPGETRHWVEHYLPLVDTDGVVFGINVVVEDVTDRKRSERAILESFEEAQRAVRERDAVLGIVSHDLRNPLSTISMASSLLFEDIPEAKKRVQADIIARSVEQMRRLIGDLLDATRIDGGGLQLVVQPCSAAALAASAVAAFVPLAEARSVALRADAARDVLVSADRERVQQVFGNLIANAIEHTPEGGEVVVAAAAVGDDAVFTVRDTGRGIPPEQQPRIFDRYWQAQRSGRGGAGLGLAIAKGIIEAHGGSIRVASEPGRGTTFTFTLPAAPQA
jgi:PAS domain S-box-containing protein